jgi:hypothetical protein
METFDPSPMVIKVGYSDPRTAQSRSTSAISIRRRQRAAAPSPEASTNFRKLCLTHI